MKSKILLSTLLGSALLVGCTADDALNVDKVAQNQEINPAAPVFTVSFENNNGTSMRANMDPDYGMQWQSIDKMSLFHGGGRIVSDRATKLEDSDDFLSAGDVKRSQAIYTQYGSGTEAVFATQSMVNEGLAIMVFPADTTYAQNGVNPTISIKQEQDKETKNLTPFVSEVLEILPYTDYNAKDDAGKHTAGYGRQYDLALRRIGAQLRLKLNAVNGEALEELGDEVAPIDYRKVIMRTDGEDMPFTTKMEIKVGQERGQLQKNGTYTTSDGSSTSKVGDNINGHSYWKYSPWIEPTDDGKQNMISTEDIGTYDETTTAFFTLLPPEDRPEKFDNKKNAEYGDLTVVVETSYGKIEIKHNDDEELWSNRQGQKATTLNEGLAAAFEALFFEQEEDALTYPLYRNQLMAAGGTRTLEVDLSELDMNDLHITTAAQLVDVLKVWKALKSGEKGTTNFYLDGDDDGAFVMDKAAWEAVEKQLKEINTTSTKVTFTPCNNPGKTNPDTHTCKKVVLDNTNGDEAEVPEIQFTTNSVPVELVGKWSYEGKADATVSGVNSAKNLELVKQLIVTKGSVLTLKAVAGAADGKGYLDAQKGLTDGIVNNGTINVDGDIYVGKKVSNSGVIEIPAKKALNVGGTTAADLVNEAASDKKANGWTASDGVINVSGTLGVPASANAKIINYGTIYQKGAGAKIYITQNEEKKDAIATLFNNGKNVSGNNSTNRIGTIDLDETVTNDQVSVFSEDLQGFIKLDVSAAVPTETDFGGIANYVVLLSGCKTIKAGKDGTGTTAKQCFVPNIKYIEVKTDGVNFEGDFTYPDATDGAGKGDNTLTALIVRGGNEVTILKNGYLNVEKYINVSEAGAKVYHPEGALLGSYKVVGYFGGTETGGNQNQGDKNNIVSTGK